jgi:S-DNA-T family DNA segregation ATPase FtsK/SpoIIIE
VPARKLNFDKEETSHIFRQTHALGNWVVNLDELLHVVQNRAKTVPRAEHFLRGALRGRRLLGLAVQLYRRSWPELAADQAT